MSDLVWNGAALAEFFNSPLGPVGRDLARRAVAVESQAKLNASGRPGPNVITGRLRSSITWAFGVDAWGIYVDIGTNVEYAKYVEKGHPNTAHAYPVMSRGGVFTGDFGYVSDNPTKPYPLLRPALKAGLV